MKTSKEIWEDLEERYGYASMAQIYSLEQQLLEVHQGQNSVSEFFTKIKTVWDGINYANPLPHCTCNKCTCNLTQRIQVKQQEQRLLQFMMKLSDQFAAVRANILMIQPLPNVSQVYRIFAQEERHKEISHLSNQTESMAFYSDKRRFPNPQFQRNNNTVGQTNNSKPRAFTPQPNSVAGGLNNKKKPYYFCTHCNIHGHSIERCFKINRYPPGFQPGQRKFANAAQITPDSDVDETDNTNESTNDDNSPVFTKEQYDQFMQFCGQKQSFSGSDVHASTSKHALLAGPFSDEASNSSW